MNEAAGRIWALSDLHIDYDENWAWLKRLSKSEFQHDALIVAGDISDRLDKMKAAFDLLRSRFARIGFVPGNHDLWVRAGDRENSLEKLQTILDVCRQMDVFTRPLRWENGLGPVWMVPLFSWYATPTDGDESLFVEKQGRDLTMALWSDRNFIDWPVHADAIHDTLFGFNEPTLAQAFDAPVISFSHFLPHTDLIFPGEKRFKDIPVEHQQRSIINFSRVAGSTRLADHIHQVGSTLHVYGHHHRNRRRHVNGVAYVSHTLGYPQEREQGWVRVDNHRPLLIWDALSPKAISR